MENQLRKGKFTSSDLEQKYYEDILRIIPGHVYWKDKEGRFLGCNLEQARDAGFSSCDEMIGKTDYDMPWGIQAAYLQDIDRNVMKTEKAITLEEIFELPDGTKKIYLSSKLPLYDDINRVSGILGISIDITDRKKLEEELFIAKEAAEASNKAKTEFLENMRHDIRTPLAGIVGFSEILNSKFDNAEFKEYTENLMASCHALRDLLNEVLEAVRVSGGEIPILKKKFNLSKIFEHLNNLYLAKAKEKNLNLNFIMNPNLPKFVLGDRIRLHRVILELIGNALNFTDKGEITVQADLAKQNERDLVISISVEDSGMGIPAEKQQEIYLQFRRLTPSYQGIYKGAGLGLYVVKKFVDDLKGEIYVKSEPKKGTRFTLLLPLQQALLNDDSGVDDNFDDLMEKPYMQPIDSKKFIATPGVNNATSKILVVEDNRLAQAVAKTILALLFCDVDLASDGKEAIELFKQEKYDLIFMDIGLGEGLDGYEVTHHIRNNEDPYSHIPIIGLTAHAGDENKQRCIEAGMDAVLAKPLTQVQATDIITRFIPSRRPEPEKPVRLDLPDTDEEMFNLDQFALLDIEPVLQHSTDKTFLMELLSDMVEKVIPEELSLMEAAFQEKDYARVAKIAHKLKGGVVYVGATRMKYACQYLERYWKAGGRDLLEDLYRQAINVINESQGYVLHWLKNAQK